MNHRLPVISVGARPYQCSYPGCSKTFKSKSGRRIHEKLVHAPPKYQCPITGCSKWFKTKQSLNIHIQDTHSDVATYQCSYPGCSKSYKHQSSLDRHVRSVHRSVKYQCPLPDCDKTFTRKESLSFHIKYTHNTDKVSRLPCPYPECNQSFKHPKSLRDHIRYIHSDTPHFKCPYPDCNKLYKRKGALNQHIRLNHQGLRPHVCEKCGKGYKRLGELRYHLDHNLCWSSGRRRNQSKIMIDHNKAANQWKNFLIETKNPKSISTELILPNSKRLDVLTQCPNKRWVGFDITIGRKSPANLRNQITEKFDRNYEKYCDIVYIVVISKVKKTPQTIRKCDRSPLKPKKTRVVHWRAIVRDNPKYVRIFQQIEDGTVF